jgi:hypothetical protein
MTRYAPLWLQQGSYAASVDRRLLSFEHGSAAGTPVAEVRGLAVTVASAMTVNIAAGQAIIPSSNNTGSVLCSSDAVEQVTLPTAPGAGLNRWDLIVCQARGNDLDGGANNDFIFNYVQGTAAASPTEPATPANATALAAIYITGGSAAVVAANINSRRLLAADQIFSWAYCTARYAQTSGQLVGFNATQYNNPAGFYDIVSHWWYPPRPGWYQVKGCLEAPVISAAWMVAFLNRNGDGPNCNLGWAYNNMGTDWGVQIPFCVDTYVSGFGKAIGIATTNGSAHINGTNSPAMSYAQVSFLHP